MTDKKIKISTTTKACNKQLQVEKHAINILKSVSTFLISGEQMIHQAKQLFHLSQTRGSTYLQHKLYWKCHTEENHLQHKVLKTLQENVIEKRAIS